MSKKQAAEVKRIHTEAQQKHRDQNAAKFGTLESCDKNDSRFRWQVQDQAGKDDRNRFLYSSNAVLPTMRRRKKW